ncbi:MAG: uroporphyrinogen-III C-methyltransferase, partial [Proteobacteria bacterium]|nr:uroporphyrinogen-III C-methyltransferase [Pseudomonadota bacterium]
QRVLVSTLAQLTADVSAAQLGSPVLVIIGQVAKLGDELRWYAQDMQAQAQAYFTEMVKKEA